VNQLNALDSGMLLSGGEETLSKPKADAKFEVIRIFDKPTRLNLSK